VLICYALVNRPYMVDLQEDRSLVRGLLERGLDVFLIDWGYPDGADRFLELDDYVNGYLDRCVQFVLGQRHRQASTCWASARAARSASATRRCTRRRSSQPGRHGHAGGFPDAGEPAVEVGARLDVDRLVDTGGNVRASC
jgi:hypothetical protein